MMYEQIIYETRGDIALLTLNRPQKLNAWTPQMAAELADALGTANADAAIGAIVLTGAGRGFCAGADLKEVQRLESELLRQCWETPEHKEAVAAFIEKRKPNFR